jgi:alkanesulfonate monooxygenase SsuD/methylene tetrahydromethanopterin reductase-like flavin-dependent oxidoreductase (luciferase family)
VVPHDTPGSPAESKAQELAQIAAKDLLLLRRRLDALAACVRIFQEARHQAKQRTRSPDIALTRYVFMADSLAQAYATVGDATLRIFETTYFQWPHPVVKRPPGTLTVQRLAEERFILGTLAECIEQIERFRQRLGLTHLICRLSFPRVPREASMTSMERFTREVMPALRQAHTS